MLILLAEVGSHPVAQNFLLRSEPVFPVVPVGPTFFFKNLVGPSRYTIAQFWNFSDWRLRSRLSI
jgi:hypothetical protein